MNIKKLCVVVLMFLVTTASVYALDLSVGASGGAGGPYFRDSEKYQVDVGENETLSSPSWISAGGQIDVLLGFMPFLALETGVGFSFSRNMQEVYGDTITTTKYITQRMQVYVPIMARGMFSYDVGIAMTSYASVGVKLGIPLDDFMYKLVDDERTTLMENADFTMDISFAIGQEVCLGGSHYVGLRVSYDLNVLDPYKETEDNVMSEEDYVFMDSINFALTYRYAFGK